MKRRQGHGPGAPECTAPGSRERKRIWRPRYGIYALYFILTALALSSGTLSRYKARVEVQDTAKTARPYIAPQFSFTAEKLYPGATKRQSFTVSNKDSGGNFVSQVKMNYRVVVKGTTNLPLYVYLKRKEGAGAVQTMDLTESLKDPATGEMTWTTRDETVMPLTEKTDTWTIELTWPGFDKNCKPGYADEVDYFTVTIEAVQSDN